MFNEMFVEATPEKNTKKSNNPKYTHTHTYNAPTYLLTTNHPAMSKQKNQNKNKKNNKKLKITIFVFNFQNGIQNKYCNIFFF